MHAIICCFANDIFFFLFQVDASVGTEMGTMTEPDCLGPLDPGTAVTLEGIVWQETDGGKVYHQLFDRAFNYLFKRILSCLSAK